MDFKGRSELHGVIASQGMRSRQYRSLGDQRGGNRDDDVLAGKISWKSATAIAASWGVIEPPRSRRVTAATVQPA